MLEFHTCDRQVGEGLAAFLGCMWPDPAVGGLYICLLLNIYCHFHVCHFREVSHVSLQYSVSPLDSRFPIYKIRVVNDPSQLCESHHRHQDICILPLSCQGGTDPYPGSWKGNESPRPFCLSLALKIAIASWLREGGIMPGGPENWLMASQCGLVNVGVYLHAWVNSKIMTRARVACFENGPE